MTTKSLEEKQSDVTDFLAEADMARLARLEQTIAGKTTLRDFVIPFVLTLGAYGLFFAMSMAGRSDPRMDMLIAFPLIMSVMAVLSALDSTSRQKQVAALKEYLDLKLSERSDRT